MFNLRDADFKQNPYSSFKDLRAQTPICRVQPHGFWAVFRHVDVVYVLKNPEVFSSAGIGEEFTEKGPALLLSTRSLLGKDKPDHTRLRKRLGRAFSNETMQNLASPIESAVQTLIGDMKKKDDIDFVRDFSAQLPIMVICKLLGFDPKRRAEIKNWSDTLLTWRVLPKSEESDKQLKSQMNNFYDFIMEALRQKKEQPSNDIISALLHAQSPEDELSAEEIISFIRMLLVAGTDTTTHLLGNTILAFMSYPEIYESIRHNTDLIPPLIEESLRFDSPVQCVMRRATRDTQMADVSIAKDELVLAFVASANRDERVYEKPNQFFIARAPQHHLTFGTGIHFCMGSQIARLQARIALHHLSHHFVSWKKPEEKLEYFNSIFFRGLTSLPIIAAL